MSGVIERINELEVLFSANKYNGNGMEPFMIEKGSIPIMISAPHAVNQFREGNLKYADMYTGGIARYLHEVTGCHVIYSCKYDKSDPNFDLPGTNRYQDALKSYVNEHGIKFLLDLHGAAKTREYAVEMGTAPGDNPLLGIRDEDDPSLHEYKHIADLVKTILEEKFASSSFDQKSVWKNRIFSAGEQNTVTNFISDFTETACMQLEINGLYRDPIHEKEFNALVDGLVKIVTEINKTEWN